MLDHPTARRLRSGNSWVSGRDYDEPVSQILDSGSGLAIYQFRGIAYQHLHLVL